MRLRTLVPAVVVILAGALPAAAAAAPDLEVIVFDVPDPVRAGNEIRYSATIRNTGPDASSGITFTLPMPTGVILPAATPSQGSCTGTVTVTCALGSLAPAAEATVTVVASPTVTGEASTTASVTGTPADGDPGDNSTPVSTTVVGTSCSIIGTAGPDDLTGSPIDDVMCGLGGNDRLDGGAGDDVLVGGRGRDTASFRSAPSGVVANLTTHRAARHGADRLYALENLQGSDHNDDLTGGRTANTIEGGIGTDLLFGKAGVDLLAGNGDDDFLAGGSGRDRLNGGTGADTCVPGSDGGRRRSCGTTSPRDRNDTASLMDVKRVKTRLSRPAPMWTVAMYSQFTSSRIEDQGFVLVYLDTLGDERPDYHALIRSSGSRVEGLLFRDRSDGREQLVASLEARRTSANSMTIVVPRKRLRLGTGRRFYRWEILTLYTGNRCQEVCFDRVPDKGAMTQPLP